MTDEQQGSVADVMKEAVEKQLNVLRYLCTCGKFDRSKMENYISMAEKIGMQWSSQEQEQMLNATIYFFPKSQSDGTVLDGYDQVRIELVGAHADAVSQSIKLINNLPPDPSLTSLLQNISSEMNTLISKLKI